MPRNSILGEGIYDSDPFFGSNGNYPNHALAEHPFSDTFTKYMRRKLDEPALDEILVHLQESQYLKELKEKLASYPKISGLYRYDPYTIGFRNDFAGGHSTGAHTAWFRAFHNLQPEHIKVVRIPNETVVIIDHPSVLISTEKATIEVTEPTVLFTTRALDTTSMRDEDMAIGTQFLHGDKISDITPRESIGNAGVTLRYYAYDREMRDSDKNGSRTSQPA